jgi:hypothetical protein
MTKKKNRRNPLGVLVEEKEWKEMVDQIVHSLVNTGNGNDEAKDVLLIKKVYTLKYENKLLPPGRMFSSDLGIKLYHTSQKKENRTITSTTMAAKCVQIINELIQENLK